MQLVAPVLAADEANRLEKPIELLRFLAAAFAELKPHSSKRGFPDVLRRRHSLLARRLLNPSPRDLAEPNGLDSHALIRHAPKRSANLAYGTVFLATEVLI